MRICRVTIGYPPRRCGWSHHAYYLSKYQAMLGHEVLVFQPRRRDNSSLATEDHQVIQVAMGPLAPYWEGKVARTIFAGLTSIWILRLSKTHFFDLIHGHGDIFEAFPLSVAAKFLRIPLVVTVHSRFSLKRRYRLVAPWIWRMVDRIIAVSPDIAEDLQSLGVNSDRVAVISSGVELERFAPVTPASRQVARRELGISSEAFVVIGVGNLSPVKGFRYLIEAMQRLSKLNGLQIYIVGDGPSRTDLSNLVDGLPSVHLAGTVPHERIRTYLHAADMFVLPSVDLPGKREGTPTAVMEAMASGLPVIVSDSGGGKYLIQASSGGIIVPQRDPKALADAILRLAVDNDLRQRMGEANRLVAQSKDWSAIAAEVEKVYRIVLKGKLQDS